MGSRRPQRRRPVGKPVTLQFWSTYNKADKEDSTFVNVVIKRFEKLNPGIKVDSVVYPYADLLPKFLATSAAGDPPDLMRSDIAVGAAAGGPGRGRRTSASCRRSPAIKANTLPGPLATTHVATGEKPGYYAFPDDTNTQALFWNKTDFAAAGISGPPKTLSQMYADAAKLTNASKQQFGLGIDGTRDLEHGAVHLERRWLVHQQPVHQGHRFHEQRQDAGGRDPAREPVQGR